MFNDLLKTIFNETVNESNTTTKNKTVNKSDTSTKDKTVNESNCSTKNKSNSSTKNESKSHYESDYESDNERDNENNENKKGKNYYEIKQLNNWFKTIDQTKSLEEQIELLKSKNFLYEYWSLKYYNNNKDLNYKIFKAKAAYLLTNLDKKIFKKVYNCDFIVLVEKLINTVDKKEENQIIIDDIKNNKSKIFKEYSLDKNINKQAGDLDDAAKIILELNEVLISDKVNNNNNNNNLI